MQSTPVLKTDAALERKGYRWIALFAGALPKKSCCLNALNEVNISLVQ
jgi:hypothetical protein